MWGKNNSSKFLQLLRMVILNNIADHYLYAFAGRCCLEEKFLNSCRNCVQTKNEKFLESHNVLVLQMKMRETHIVIAVITLKILCNQANHILCCFSKKVVIFHYLVFYFFIFKAATVSRKKFNFSLQFQHQYTLSVSIHS